MSLIVVYRNYRGEVDEREIVPMSVRYGSTEWHPTPQWLMLAWDVKKGALREFAMDDMAGRKVFQAEALPDGT
jgi:hypothetical protein